MKTFSFKIRVAKPDKGFTLVGLLVGISLGFIVLALLASMMIGVYGTQDRVSRSSNAATNAQVSSEVFRSAIRSATGVKLSAVTVDGVSGQLLVTRTLDRSNPGSFDPTSRCIGFLWKSALAAGQPGALYWQAVPIGTSLPAATSSNGWSELVTEITPIPPSSGVSLIPTIFLVEGNKYTLAFSTEPGLGPKTTVKVGVMAPVVDDEVSGGCY